MIDATRRRAADAWFLDHGLPAVLRPGALVRRLWPRSAPALAGFAVFMANSALVVAVTGKHTIDIDGHPTRTEWFVLALTACGAGSILGWAAQTTMSNLAAAGALVTRALPLLLLTFLVFFNSPVWLMASTVSRPRLWLALLFLTLIAAAFVVSVTADRVKPIVEADDPADDNSVRLSGTPFETMPDPATARVLGRAERLNVMFVVAVSQLSQILIIAAMTALLFLILGLILLSPELLAAWTRNGRSDGTVLGMTIPVPDSLIQITFFLGALTFMYISARTVSDADYRTRFFDPLIDDVRLTLKARNRYRAAVAAR
jgi:hypothetical protein